MQKQNRDPMLRAQGVFALGSSSFVHNRLERKFGLCAFWRGFCGSDPMIVRVADLASHGRTGEDFLVAKPGTQRVLDVVDANIGRGRQELPVVDSVACGVNVVIKPDGNRRIGRRDIQGVDVVEMIPS